VAVFFIQVLGLPRRQTRIQAGNIVTGNPLLPGKTFDISKASFNIVLKSCALTYLTIRLY
jgi:hypothetical protein